MNKSTSAKLQLDITSRASESGYDAAETYRDDRLSVGQNYLRFEGQNIEMSATMKDLMIGERLGQGACSSVHLATHKLTGQSFAVKMFNVFDKSQANQLLKEITVLLSNNCEALIDLKGAFHNDGSIGVVLEYMDRGSLDNILHGQTSVTEEALAAIVYQICWGLNYLHANHKLHRDIKPSNALLNSRGQIKLSDFGIAKQLEDRQASSVTSVGTFKYMSPERLLGQEYDKSSDVWAVGIMALEIFTKVHPFHYCSSTPIDLVAELEVLDIEKLIPTDKFEPCMRDLIAKTLKLDPLERISCDDVLRHEWFGRFQIKTLESAQMVWF